MIKNIVWPKDITEEQKEAFLQMFKDKIERENSIMVVYNPDCGCKIDQFFLLDRFPMSPKIVSQCPECKKGFLMEISDPIIFHDPISKTDFGVPELKDAVIADTRQREFLENYRDSSFLTENITKVLKRKIRKKNEK